MSKFDLQKSLHQEKQLLEKAQVPIITVSGTFRKELIETYSDHSHIHSEALFSRAHYSMAAAVQTQAKRMRKTAHLIDPTNFVPCETWSKIKFTEEVGQQMARHQTLKWVKDKIDTVVRNKLPITDAITPPLLHLISNVKKPLLSLHYEAGNIAAHAGHSVLQVLTDPHVRPQYLDPLPSINTQTKSNTTKRYTLDARRSIYYAVFDLPTKHDLLHQANLQGKLLYPRQIIVTGPPVDPRITKLAQNRPKITPHRPVNVGITTGGLGTNLNEIRSLLHQLTPLLKPRSQHIKLFLYAGTHPDFRHTFESFAADNNLRIGNLTDTQADIRILYEDSLIDANNNLINYLFPWADVIITKPSGDMAYDAVAAGCALLLLEPWGPWEKNIQTRMIKLGAASDLSIHKAHKHFTYLLTTNHLAKYQTKAINLPPLYRHGCKKIVHLHTQLSTDQKKQLSTTPPSQV